MTNSTPVIDVQVHAYERNRPERPWHGHLEGPDEVTGDDMVAAMDAVGVDGAILVSPFSMYQYDASYALEVYAKHPGNFGLVRPFDTDSETIEQEMEEWTATPGVVGARIMLARVEIEADNPGVNQILAAGAKANIPINVMCSGKLPIFREMARNHPNIQLIIDHLGIAQPYEPPAPPDAWDDLPAVLELAQFDNVAIKISGAGTLAHEPFPYPDIWERPNPNLQRLQPRPLHVGHRLDPRRKPPNLRARRRSLPSNRPTHRLRTRNPHGRLPPKHLQMVTDQYPLSLNGRALG